MGSCRFGRAALSVEYDFHITRRAGSSKVVANALSRAPLQVWNNQATKRRLAHEARTPLDGKIPGSGRTPGAGDDEDTEVAPMVPAGGGQLTDGAIRRHQQSDKLSQKLRTMRSHKGHKVVTKEGIV
ncbi:unnamed protein product [Phytophthora fragariaefolia]|uniref:Unnamed protein product n=1 Tax=Phytophthora fragariaefolia TaxID=1490495 RepID=A0A9W6XTW4_9STRA|nr:unnamed protein product [Phytophthora fragariaefolia]